MPLNVFLLYNDPLLMLVGPALLLRWAAQPYGRC